MRKVMHFTRIRYLLLHEGDHEISTPWDISGMDENEELLNQLMEGMPPETRFRMQRFIRLVAERDECALKIIRQIEAGRVAPTDALDALDRCLATW